MSFFDEDDEPPTRVRPRRATTARGRATSARPPDRQTALLRQLVLFGGIVVLLLALVIGINSCRQAAKENALRDYNRDVGALIRDSDQQVSEPFFNLLRDPSQGDLSAQINGFKVTADQQYERAKRISTPDEMAAAQRSFLIAMEMRSDGLTSIADKVRSALSSDNEAADEAITQIAGAMEMFLASDVIYQSRVLPLIGGALREADVGGQELQRTEFLPGIEWLQAATIADALGQQLSAGGGGGGGREPLPGLHGTGIDSVQVGELTLEPGTANRIAYGPDTEFTVNFTNQGEHDEADVDVVVRIEGGPKPIRVQDTVPAVATGAAAAATLSLPEDPPFGVPVTIRVQVKPVPGEEKTDNNVAEYEGFFSQG